MVILVLSTVFMLTLVLLGARPSRASVSHKAPELDVIAWTPPPEWRFPPESVEANRIDITTNPFMDTRQYVSRKTGSNLSLLVPLKRYRELCFICRSTTSRVDRRDPFCPTCNCYISANHVIKVSE